MFSLCLWPGQEETLNQHLLLPPLSTDTLFINILKNPWSIRVEIIKETLPAVTRSAFELNKGNVLSSFTDRADSISSLEQPGITFFPKRQWYNIVPPFCLAGGNYQCLGAEGPSYHSVGQKQEGERTPWKKILLSGQSSRRKNAIWPSWLPETQVFAKK